MAPAPANERPFTIDGFTFPPVGERVYMPVEPHELYGLSSDERYEVVGESHHRDSIAAFVERHAREADPDQGIYAMLLHEHLNPFDHNAVRVDLFWDGVPATCGHLPREQARLFAPAIDKVADEGKIVAILATVFGGTPDKPNYGVWLG